VANFNNFCTCLKVEVCRTLGELAPALRPEHLDMQELNNFWVRDLMVIGPVLETVSLFRHCLKVVQASEMVLVEIGRA
jgi:hypothetical protein